MIQNILQHKKPQANFTKIFNPTINQLITNPSEIQKTIIKGKVVYDRNNTTKEC